MKIFNLIKTLVKLICVTLMALSLPVLAQQLDQKSKEAATLVYQNCQQSNRFSGIGITSNGLAEVCKCVAITLVRKFPYEGNSTVDELIEESNAYCLGWAKNKQSSLPAGTFFFDQFGAGSGSPVVPNLIQPQVPNDRSTQSRCFTDNLGRTSCDNGSSVTSDGRLLRFNDGTTATTNSGGLTRFSNGVSCDTDKLGLTRCSDGTTCTTDRAGMTRCSAPR